jgi:signal peptidase II
MTRAGRIWLFAALTLGTFGCDHATKLVARTYLAERPVTIVPHVLELRLADNREVGFDLTRGLALPHKPLWLGVAALGTLCALGLWWRRHRPADLVPLALLLAGGLGNASERLARGFVTDFIYLHYWPVFNVADVLVACGIGLAALHQGSRRARAP